MNPFYDHTESTVASIGESKLIQLMRLWLGEASPPSPEGIGDDCALINLPVGGRQLATVDPIIFGKHFDESITATEAAAKLLRRNASDIAAMGGAPQYALVSLSLPGNVRLDWLEQFYRSLARESLDLGIRISGGDLSNNDNQHLAASLTLMGWLPNDSNPLLRKRGIAGDSIYVTGSLGGSILSKHYSFSPRLSEGQFLASRQARISCLDLSDGLGKDGPQLPTQGCYAVIDANKIPISDDAMTLSIRSKKSPLHHAINDGEDYELLFSIALENENDFVTDWKVRFETPLSKIGYIESKTEESDPDIVLVNDSHNTELLGYEHLR